MPKTSAGLLMYRMRNGGPEFLLVHPGGPFWKNKDDGAWSIPKGEPSPEEPPLTTAEREFEEELGIKAEGNFKELNPIRQKGGKVVYAWAFEGDCDPAKIKGNTFELEWPPRSGKFGSFPEVDEAAFFPYEAARTKINPAQIPLLEEVLRAVS
jgi:predicted NUDIX family NTP pyrophosphohydrolase